MTFMKQIFTLFVLRFGRLAGFVCQMQRRMLCGNSSSPEIMRTGSGARCIGNLDEGNACRNNFNSFATRDVFFRSGFNFFAKFAAGHCRSAVIPKRSAAISVGKNTNPRRSFKFSFFVQSTTAIFSTRRGWVSDAFPLSLSALFENLCLVRRIA